MSLATQGRAREYRVRDHLASFGWEPVMRAAGSKGAADLLLGSMTRGAILVQVGTASKSLSPADRRRFVHAAAITRATPVLATVTKTGIEYRIVTTFTQRYWATWKPETTT